MDVKKWGSNLNRLLFNLADKIDLRRKDKYIALSSISIYYAFDKSRNILIKKIKIWAVKNIFPLDFAKYPNYSEVQKNNKTTNL